MGSLDSLGRSLVVAGVVIALLGVVIVLGPRIPILGRLPGNLKLEVGEVTIYIPLATMLIVSVVASVVLGLMSRR